MALRVGSQYHFSVLRNEPRTESFRAGNLGAEMATIRAGNCGQGWGVLENAL